MRLQKQRTHSGLQCLGARRRVGVPVDPPAIGVVVGGSQLAQPREPPALLAVEPAEAHDDWHAALGAVVYDADGVPVGHCRDAVQVGEDAAGLQMVEVGGVAFGNAEQAHSMRVIA